MTVSGATARLFRRMAWPRTVRCLLTGGGWILLLAYYTTDLHHIAPAAHALSMKINQNKPCSSSSSFLMFKTKETFKLADVQFLEWKLLLALASPLSTAQEQEHSQHYGKCHRLLLDRATGSSLIVVELLTNNSHQGNDVKTIPTAESLLANDDVIQTLAPRVDWAGRVLANHSSDPHAFVQQISNRLGKDRSSALVPAVQPKNVVRLKPWTMTYRRFRNIKSSKEQPRTRIISSTALLCSVAQAIDTPALLVQSDDDGVAEDRPNDKTTDELLLVDADDGGYYLLQKIAVSSTFLSSTGGDFSKVWSHRPFPYSSAMNPEVTEMLTPLLLKMAESSYRRHPHQQSPPQRLNLLDPTCGSGSFLARALWTTGRQPQTEIKLSWNVVGLDVNPKCTEGTVANLRYIVEKGLNESIDDESRFQVHLHDSSLAFPASLPPVDAVIANLPWGINSVISSSSEQKENNNSSNQQTGSGRQQQLYADILTATKNLVLGKTNSNYMDTSVPCAFVFPGRLDENDNNHGVNDYDPGRLVESCGYNVLNVANIPPLDFALPVSSKKKKKHKDEDATTKSAAGRRKQRAPTTSDCVIVVSQLSRNA